MRVAKVLLIDDSGAALVLRRSGTHPHHAYEPDLPGGIIEHNESYEEGLMREMNEEIGVVVDPLELTLLAEKDSHGFSHKRLYKLSLDHRPVVTISWEHDRYEWVEKGKLHDALTSTDSYMQFVADYIFKNRLY